MSWWLTTPWTARTTWRRRPQRSLKKRMYHLGWNFLQLGCDMLSLYWLTWKFFLFQHVLQDLIHISWWMTTPWTARSTRRRRPGDVSLQLESLVFCSSLLASFSSFSTLLYHEPCCCHKHRSCQTLKCTHHQNSSSHPRLHWRTF